MKGTDRYYIVGVTCTLDDRVLSVANLSVSGLFAATEDPPAVGRVINIQLRLRDDGSPIRVKGQVTWINGSGPSRVPHLPPGFGLRMLRLSFDDRMQIIRLLGDAGPKALRAHPPKKASAG